MAIDLPSSIDLTSADVYTILSNKRRRETIRMLASQLRADDNEDTYVPVSPLSTMVHKSDHGPPSSEDISAGHHQVYVTLTQTHLPLLDELRVIEYYSRPQKVRPTETTLALDDLLTIINDACAGE